MEGSADVLSDYGGAVVCMEAFFPTGIIFVEFPISYYHTLTVTWYIYMFVLLVLFCATGCKFSDYTCSANGKH